MKVIGFDGWTEGSHHYSRLVPALKKMGIELKLIHFGSWGHDKNRPLYEMIENLPVFDIAFYGDRSLLDVLQLEEPDAIIFLSTQSFPHQAVNRYAAMLRIPTLHLYHGLIAVQAVETGSPDRYSLFAQTRLVFSRAIKNVTKMLPAYIKALVYTRASAGNWIMLIKNIIYKIVGRYVISAANDSKTDYCAVYTSQDLQHAHTVYHVDIENIRVVGNPDLVRFNLMTNDIGRCTSNNANNNIMYIDHGGSTCALNFRSPEEFIQFLEVTSEALRLQGYSLIVKLHPSQLSTPTPRKIQEKGIELSTNETFVADLRNCCAAISGPSTASLIPALMGLPLFLAQYAEFEGQVYGNALLSYPRRILLKDISNIRLPISDNVDFYERAKLLKWIDENTGPLPLDKMPERVASIVEEMIASSKRSILV